MKIESIIICFGGNIKYELWRLHMNLFHENSQHGAKFDPDLDHLDHIIQKAKYIIQIMGIRPLSHIFKFYRLYFYCWNPSASNVVS